jgi:hypothetical protein
VITKKHIYKTKIIIKTSYNKKKMSNENTDLLAAYKERQSSLLRYGDGCRGFFIGLTVITVLAAAAVSIVALVVGQQSASINRFCLNDYPKILGRIELQSNERVIEYELQHTNLTSVIISLPIHGPIPPGLEDGPLAIELCGSISGVACDITSEANKVHGKLLQAQPGSTSLRPVIRAIRKEPWRYYTRVMTANGEESRISLTSLCGTAV